MKNEVRVLGFWHSWFKDFLVCFWEDICRANQLVDFFKANMYRSVTLIYNMHF